jgi:hypothetical protein
MTSHRPSFRRWLPLAALALAFGAGAARADHLDDKLNAQAPRLVEALRKDKVKNVGVLRFRVQEGNRPETFNAGPLNGNLAVRLENILVMHSGSDADADALNVIHNAGQEAARHKVGKWYGDEAEQRKLFALDSYPLAWGTSKVKADAFLTGVVKVAPDYRNNTVVIEELRAPGQVEKLLEFTFEGDPALLMDLGKSYSLSRRTLAGARSAAKTRDLVFVAVKKGDDDASSNNTSPGGGSNTNPGGGKVTTAANDQPVVTKDTIEVGGVEFQLLSGDQAVPFKANSSSNNANGYSLESPEPGKEVVFKITNKTDKPLGVDVKLNGTSLFLEQTDEPANCRVWILKPEDKYRSYALKGYYVRNGDGEKMKIAPFKVLVGDEAQKWRDGMSQLADKVGTISITVFEEGDQTGSEMLVTARGVKKSKEKEARADRATLQNDLMKASYLKRDAVKRELIVADKESMKDVEDGLFKSVDFQRKPVAIGSATINVLPKSAPSGNGNGSK